MRKAQFEARQAAAHAVWQSGTIAIDLKKGFELKYHEEHPDAPRSPIYVSLRPDGVKDGKLKPEHLDAIGYAMATMALQEGGLLRQGTHTWVAGIPAAGEPILDAIIRNIGPRRRERILEFKLEKEVTEAGRRIKGVHPDYQGLVPNDEGDSHVLVDDLMSNMDTKREAVEAVNNYGASISTLLLFLDRSVRGADILRSSIGLRTLSVWTYDDLIEFGLAHNYINRPTFEAIVTYPEQLEKYKQQAS